MSTPERPTPPPAVPERGLRHVYRNGINWPLSIVATVAVSAGLSAGLHTPNYRKGSFMNRADTAWTYEPTYVTEQIISKTSSIKESQSKTEQRVGGQKGYKKVELNGGKQHWSENFAQSPNAGKFVSAKTLQELVVDLEDLSLVRGNHIYSLTFQGFASAEDEAADGGFTSKSALNRGLADKRAHVASQDFAQVLHSNADNKVLANLMHRQGTEIKFAPPVEQQLTEKQDKALEARARRAGFASASDFVDAWNRDSRSVNRRDRKYLNRLLGEARKVVVSIQYGKPGYDIINEKKFCVQTNTTDIKAKIDRNKDNLPLPIIIPIPIPRRRPRDEEPEADSNAGPEQVQTAKTGETGITEETGAKDGPSIYPVPKPNLPESRFVRWGRYGWIGAASLMVAAALFINEEGNNCEGRHHRPMPSLVGVIWGAIHGGDQTGEWSIGVPFSESLQYDFEHFENQATCGRSGPAVPPNNPTNPACTQVEVVRRNGVVISREVTHQAGPYESRTYRQPLPANANN